MQPNLYDLMERDAAMAQVEANAGVEFAEAAAGFITNFLECVEQATGERLTDACKQRGIVPHDDRAFGPVFMRLLRQGKIVRVGYCQRTKGHGTAGGSIYARGTS